ncbi:hypothetical protein BDL97_15G029600 [Sphagnum fallax]|jgi:glycerophosphoryl diester phosphodiesterase|nr:hypothetical protein BDL97_15G029600 [Sphagnum fallax]KAH8939280.1 hypothetical protein BDL97_15G029600 [Sphagnum fallax]
MASSTSGCIIIALLVLFLTTPAPVAARHHERVLKHSSGKKPLQTERPYNIAHRGANGELPEETHAAYERAVVEGTDFLETDIISTKDGKLICFHDLILDATTDIANHTEFKDRVRTYEVQGANVTGFFTVDFTLAEILTLGAVQRWPFRDQSYNGKYKVITFEEYIEIALSTTDRIVGIYPEIKNPVFINQHVKWPGGKTHENIFVETLQKYGYGGKYLSEAWKQKPLFIQSFAPTALAKAATLIDSPLIFLIDDFSVPTQDTNLTFYQITTNQYFDYLVSFGVVGIGPWKDNIAIPNAENYAAPPTHLIRRAHDHGLQVHPYTFRNENQFLHFNYHQDPYQEYIYWLADLKVDGLFTDFCGSLKLYQDWAMPLKMQ